MTAATRHTCGGPAFGGPSDEQRAEAVTLARKAAGKRPEPVVLESCAYHRNGISGAGFYVCLFRTPMDGKWRNMVATLLDARSMRDIGAVPCFVLDRDTLAGGNILFGHNSYRGDHYWGPLVLAMAECGHLYPDFFVADGEDA